MIRSASGNRLVASGKGKFEFRVAKVWISSHQAFPLLSLTSRAESARSRSIMRFHRVVLPGLVVGKLTVLRPVEQCQLPDHVLLSYRSQGQMYECQCECGELAYWPEKLLSREQVKSCGCLTIARRRAGMLKRENQDRLRQVRKLIESLQLEQAKHRMRGTLDQHPEVAEQLRKAFKELKDLGYTR